jgi:stearoyl-CoA desaturase (Delta-9 desaturase)
MNSSRYINWSNTIFLIAVPIVGVVGTILLYLYDHVAWQTWVLTGIFYLFTGLSITGGYHRLFSHQSYKAKWPVRLFFALFGAATFQSSILEWCTDHRDHHRYTDTPKDPYNIKQGFWHAHMGWLFSLDYSKHDFSNVPDLVADPIVAFQHKYYRPLAIVMGVLLPTAIAAFWGNAWGGLLVAGFLRMAILFQGTFCINSVCHMLGKRPYSDKQSARDNWLSALLTMGEGYHNFHHQFPIDYRNAIKFYQFDPTKWLIKLLSWVGLASDLKTVSQEKIIRYRVQQQQQQIISQIPSKTDGIVKHLNDVVNPAYEKILQIIAQIEELDKTYRKVKKEQLQHMQHKMNEYRDSIKAARQELKQHLSHWSKLVERYWHMLKA